MDKALMLDAIKKHLKIKKNKDFADFLGISSQAISNWYTRNTFDAELIYTKCLFVNPAWLLTGKGNMIGDNQPSITEKENSVCNTKELIEKICELSAKNALLENYVERLEKENNSLKSATQKPDKENTLD